MSKCGIIYKVTNTINGKIYIGKTIQPLNKRKYTHKSYSKKDVLTRKNIFHNAIRKYGWDAFKWEILCECIDYDILSLTETMKIIVNNSHYIDGHGYNMTYGGEGCIGYKHTKTSREKISKSKIGSKNPMFEKTTNGFKNHKHTIKSKRKISNKMSNIWNELSEKEKENRLGGLRNHIMTDEEKLKRSKTLIGHKVNKETRKKISNSLKRYYELKKEKLLCLNQM